MHFQRGIRSMLATLLAVPVTADASAAQHVRDSSGVRLVTYRNNEGPREQWTVSSTPFVRLGGGEPGAPTDLVGVLTAARLSSGAIAIALSSSSEIRILMPNGTHVRTLGRQGQGPGEFDRLIDMWRIGDSLTGFDARRIAQHFDPAGRLIRSEPRPQLPTGATLVLRAGFLSGNSFLYYVLDPIPAQADDWVTVYFTLYARSSDSVRNLGRFPYADAKRPQGSPVVRRVFGPVGRATAVGHHYCVAHSRDFDIQCFDATGRLLTHVRRLLTGGRAVTATDRAKYFQGVERANPGERGREYVTALKAATVFAERLPAHGRMLGSVDGRLWVSDAIIEDQLPGSANPIPAAPVKWSVFSPRGEWLADITTPRGFRLLESGEEYVAGLVTNEAGVEWLELYSIRRP